LSESDINKVLAAPKFLKYQNLSLDEIIKIKVFTRNKELTFASNVSGCISLSELPMPI